MFSDEALEEIDMHALKKDFDLLFDRTEKLEIKNNESFEAVHGHINRHIKTCTDQFEVDDKRYEEIYGKLSSIIEFLEPLKQEKSDREAVVRVVDKWKKRARWLLEIPVLGAGIYGIASWLISKSASI